MKRIQETVVVVVAAAQLAVSPLPRHGKRAAASPLASPSPHCALPLREGSGGRDGSGFFFVFFWPKGNFKTTFATSAIFNWASFI